LNADVVGRLHPSPARHAEGANLRLLQRQLCRSLEILGILCVARRVAAFDEIDADLVEALRDLQLVLQREADALALRTVAEGGVVDLDLSHGSQTKKALKPR